MNKYRLLGYFLTINCAGLGVLVLAYLNGWVAQVIAADSSYISYIIFGLFIVALLSAGRRILLISSELDYLHSHSDEHLQQYRQALSRNHNAQRALEINLFARISHIRTIGNGLVVLGLIGTVIGFILVAGEVNADSASDVGQVGALVGALLHGMGVAFYTTLVGAIFSLWLSLNYQLLQNGTAALITAVISDSGAPPLLGRLQGVLSHGA